MRKVLMILALCLSFNSFHAYGEGAPCEGTFVNPITDICWACLLPITIGSVPVAASSLGLPDTKNPALPVCGCKAPPPVYYRVGIALGYWEPFALSDATRAPYCMVNMGFELDMGPNMQKIGGSGNADSQSQDSSQGSFYWAHWYKYPVTYWLNILVNAGCLQTESFDIAYMGELDPTWDDDELAFILNPEEALFGNPVAQLACAVDAASATAHLGPIDALFWCAGSQGSLYPFTGNVYHAYSEVSNGVLVGERLNAKFHRTGIIPDTVGSWPAMCHQYYQPILPKSRYRYQYTNVIPEPYMCHSYGESTVGWDAGKNNPAVNQNFGFLHWRKRNCCYY